MNPIERKVLTDKALLDITKTMPMKQINVNGRPYLQRFYAGTFKDGKDLWLHRFLSCDGEDHLHSHPFNFETIILNGGYTEELEPLQEGVKRYDIRLPLAGIDYGPIVARFTNMLNNPHIESKPRSDHIYMLCGNMAKTISVFDWHRIASVEPMTWTAMIVDNKRLPMWFFKDKNGELESVKASHRFWWKNYGIRPDSGICDGDDDNRIAGF